MRFTESNVNQAVGPKMKEKSFVIKQKTYNISKRSCGGRNFIYKILTIILRFISFVVYFDL